VQWVKLDGQSELAQAGRQFLGYSRLLARGAIDAHQGEKVL
jgi:hypothetical protein